MLARSRRAASTVCSRLRDAPARLLGRAAGVDRVLHGGDDQLLAELGHAPVAELEHLGEVVARVDVHDREREAAPGRNAFSARRSSTIESLPPLNSSTGPLELGGDLAHDVDRLGLERAQLRQAQAVDAVAVTLGLRSGGSARSTPRERAADWRRIGAGRAASAGPTPVSAADRRRGSRGEVLVDDDAAARSRAGEPARPGAARRASSRSTRCPMRREGVDRLAPASRLLGAPACVWIAVHSETAWATLSRADHLHVAQRRRQPTSSERRPAGQLARPQVVDVAPHHLRRRTRRSASCPRAQRGLESRTTLRAGAADPTRGSSSSTRGSSTSVEVLARLVGQPRGLEDLEVLVRDGRRRRWPRAARTAACSRCAGWRRRVGPQVGRVVTSLYLDSRIDMTLTKRRTSSTCIRTTPGGTSSPTATRSRRRTSSGSPTRGCCSARRSARRRRARAAAPRLLTGEYSAHQRDAGPGPPRLRLADYDHHLVHTLRDAGYSSALIGEQHLSRDPACSATTTSSRSTPRTSTTSRPPRPRSLRERRREPFFLSVGFFETHREYFEPTSVRDALYSLPPANLPDTPETRRDMAAYKASARSLDQGVGAVLNALDEHDLADDTLVILTTDHGLAFPGAKATLTDRGHRRAADHARPGRLPRRPGLRRARLPDRPLPDDLRARRDRAARTGLQGRSLLPLLRREVDEINDAVFAEITFHAAYEPQRAVRTKRYKYIRRFDDRPRGPGARRTSTTARARTCCSRRAGRARRCRARSSTTSSSTRSEAHNLAADPAHARVLAELRERLERWMQETDDPLLDGAVPAPPGARAQPPRPALARRGACA